MLPDGSISGWNSIDETPVPVRSSAEPGTPVQVTTEGPAHDIAATERGHIQIGQHEAGVVHSRGMTLSAALGVFLALGGVGLYLGIGGVNLQGDLTGGSNSIIITDAGAFNPSSVDLHPGDSVTITNQNPDPQVLKPKGGRDLFPVQVVFDQPYTFTVPENAAGEYVYYSETLPEDRTVTFRVTAAPAQDSGVTSSAAVSSSSPSDSVSIPLPFGGGSVDIAPADIPTPPPAVPASAPVVIESTPHSGDTATISIGGTSSSAQSTQPSGGAIPTNPYTVGSAPKESDIASSAAANLHSGAPLLVDKIQTPRRTPDSGAGGFMLLFVPALLGVVVVSRRMNLA